MAKSRIIKELVSEKITVLQALDRMLVIAMEIGDEALLKWMHQEKDGYKVEDVPEYRKISMRPVGTFQFYNMGTMTTCKNQNLATIGVPDEIMQYINNHALKDSIASILDLIETIDKGGMAGTAIKPEWFHMFEEGTNIHLLSAMLVISKTDLIRVIDATKTRMIEVLTILEKNFGCLDEVDIDIRDYDSNEIALLREELLKIINGKPTANTYIITKSKIKGSNLGENNTIDKDTSVEVSPSVEVNSGEKKNGFLSWIKRLFGRKK